MSLQLDCWNEDIPEDTAWIGQAVLIEDNAYRRVGDEVNTFLSLKDFAKLYDPGGRGGICPIILSGSSRSSSPRARSAPVGAARW